MATAARALVSVGDEGVLNRELGEVLSDVWIDRDLSWLDFNDRVLAEATDKRTPLLQRAMFLAIFTSNLDEFFMKRMPALHRSQSSGGAALLAKVRERLTDALRKQSECFRNELIPALAAEGIRLLRWDDLTEGQRAEASRYFDEQISPALTPLVFDPAHPFPFLSNLSVSLAFLLTDPRNGNKSYARLKVPPTLKQWVEVTAEVPVGQKVLTPLYEVIRGNVHQLYGGMELTGTTLFRLTRDAEVEIDEDAEENVREQVREGIRQRRYEPAVRLEFAPGANASIRKMLQERFELSATEIFDLPGELDYTSLFQISGLPYPHLRETPWTPLLVPAIERAGDIFAAIRASDILLHHPYESFEDSVSRFVAEAATDPDTVAVKMTVYRIGDDTPFVKSLMKAAESGKQVACIIELQARFDEERNLHWAAELERVGAHVTFGVAGLKTHAKVALVVRKEGSGLRSYAHIGTGNYHVRTAKMYSDVGLLTCDPRITTDVVRLFHFLTGHSEPPRYKSLLVAPDTLRPGLLALIEREISNRREGKPARIVAKMNQLEDPDLIEALCRATAAGVPVDLIVRGFCCLRPGVPGRTEGLRVRSIIGRFLEHSRIFCFAVGEAEPRDGEFYIGSADWMYRNLSKRVEVVTPILAKEGRARLWEILDVFLRDRRQAWVLEESGSYSRLYPEDGATGSGPEVVGSQAFFMECTRLLSE